MFRLRHGVACATFVLAFVCSVHAAAPTAAITASPVTGRAPLGVFFDATPSSADAVTFLWDFGDGASSTAKTVTHIYTVAGTYIAKLQAFNAAGEVGNAQITITVTGSVEGPVTEEMNFRWATTTSTFTLRHGRTERDSLNLFATFNTVDLPTNLEGLAASFSINGVFKVEGVMNAEGVIQNPERRLRPSFFIQLFPKEQTLSVFISKANLAAALALSGATNAPVRAPGIETPVTFTFTIGAQTYSVTLAYDYISTQNANGQGKYDPRKNLGNVVDGFFAISRASALENFEGEGHFYEFEGFLAQPNGKDFVLPTSGVVKFKLNEADTQIVPFDRFIRSGQKIVFEQSDRDLSGVKLFSLDIVSRRLLIKTWDVILEERDGGTALPRRGENFEAFNFALRIDIDQPDGTTFQGVTATRLTRRSIDDGFWQTGRGSKRQ